VSHGAESEVLKRLDAALSDAQVALLDERARSQALEARLRSELWACKEELEDIKFSLRTGPSYILRFAF
jgi:hypothetical protein